MTIQAVGLVDTPSADDGMLRNIHGVCHGGARPSRRVGDETSGYGSTRALRQAQGRPPSDSQPAHHERVGTATGRRAGLRRRPYGRCGGGGIEGRRGLGAAGSRPGTPGWRREVGVARWGDGRERARVPGCAQPGPQGRQPGARAGGFAGGLGCAGDPSPNAANGFCLSPRRG